MRCFGKKKQDVGNYIIWTPDLQYYGDAAFWMKLQEDIMMQERVFTESDWKLFRKRLPGWQESYMEGLNREYMKILSGDAKASDKFWELEKRIREDQKKVGVQARMSRSKLLYNMVSLINEGAIDMNDLEGFSDNLKEAVAVWTRQDY